MVLPELVAEVMEVMPDGVVVTDQAGRIVFVSQQMLAWSGYSAEELIEQPIETLVPMDRREEHRGHRSGYQAAPARRAMGTDLGFRVRPAV